MQEQFTLCKEIAELYYRQVPTHAEKIRIDVDMLDDFSSIGAFAILSNSKRVCFDLDDVSDDFYEKTRNIFEQLRKLMKKDNKTWCKCFFYIKKNGAYEVDYFLNPDGCER